MNRFVVGLLIVVLVVIAGCESPTAAVPDATDVAMDVVPVFHGETSVTRAIYIPDDIYTSGGDNTALMWSAFTPAILGFRNAADGEKVNGTSKLTAEYMGVTFSFDVSVDAGTFTLTGSSTGRDDYIILNYTPSTREFSYEQCVVLFKDNDPTDPGFDPATALSQDPVWAYSSMQGTIGEDNSVQVELTLYHVDGDSTFDAGFSLVRTKAEYFSNSLYAGIYLSPNASDRWQSSGAYDQFGPLDSFPTIADAPTLTGADFTDSVEHFPMENGQYVYQVKASGNFVFTQDTDPDPPWTPLP